MAKTGMLEYVTTLSYALFGNRTPRFTSFRRIYEKSGISRIYEAYVALMFFASLIAFASTFTVGILTHHLLFNLRLLQCFIAVLTLSCVASIITLIMFITYPLYRRGQRRKEIDANLVYTTGYMGVLSAGGLSIEKIFERVTQVEQHATIRDLAKRLIADIKVFGMDVTSALNDIILRSSSEIFSKLLIGISNTVKTSGDLKSLLTFETERLLHTKREQAKKTLGTLLTLGEIYVAAMVMGPVLFIVMLTILSIMGSVAFGLSPIEQLNLIVFFGLPAICTVFIVIINSVVPEEE